MIRCTKSDKVFKITFDLAAENLQEGDFQLLVSVGPTKSFEISKERVLAIKKTPTQYSLQWTKATFERSISIQFNKHVSICSVFIHGGKSKYILESK